jgi:hypothetical protein
MTAVQVTIDTTQPIRLKNRDLIDFERVTGKSFVDEMTGLEKLKEALKETAKELKDAELTKLKEAGGTPDWLTMTALLWVLGRRNNPVFTFEDALDADVDQQQLISLITLIADPTAPADTTAT